MGKCVHVLDVYRKSLLQHGPDPKFLGRNIWSMERDDEIIWSSTKLNEAGIRFKKSATTSLRDITFAGGVLRLLVVVVDDTSESMFLNLMAFERFHVGAGNEVTSYMIFMDNIIDNARDVSILHSKGIIQNGLGSDKAVADLFNSLSKDVTEDRDSSLHVVQKRVYRSCRKPWNNWRANLIHTYFRNPCMGCYLFYCWCRPLCAHYSSDWISNISSLLSYPRHLSSCGSSASKPFNFRLQFFINSQHT